MESTCLWKTHAIIPSTNFCTKNQLCIHKLCAIYKWHFPILCSQSRPNHAPRPQQNIHLPICTNPRHNRRIQSSARSCINAPKRNYPLSVQQYYIDDRNRCCLPCSTRIPQLHCISIINYSMSTSTPNSLFWRNSRPSKQWFPPHLKQKQVALSKMYRI